MFWVGISLDLLDPVLYGQSSGPCIVPVGHNGYSSLCGFWDLPRLEQALDQGKQPRSWNIPFPANGHAKTRIRYGFISSAGLFTLLWIWVLIVQHDFVVDPPEAIDWTSPKFGRAFGMYIMLQTSGNVVQNYLYFLMGTVGDGTLELSRSTGLLRGVESWGQCASFGISSR